MPQGKKRAKANGRKTKASKANGRKTKASKANASKASKTSPPKTKASKTRASLKAQVRTSGAPEHRRIVIRDEKHGLPYSKGLMASSIMATGLSPGEAYDAAQRVEDKLIADGMTSVTIQQLRKITSQTLLETVGEVIAARYLKWQALGKLDKPLIVLIGGTTGVGKSTIATEIAHRLGITRIVSTDSIREVMRAIFSEDLMPALYDSSFNAWKALRVPVPPPADPVAIGFREQTAAVAVGIRAIIERAMTEGVHTIVEGIHLVPGFLNLDRFRDKVFVVPLVVHIEDENLHRSHFYIRELETEGFRPFERYRANFDNIRRIGEYIEDLARDHSIPLVHSQQLDVTVMTVLEEIINRVIAEVHWETSDGDDRKRKGTG
ncbi:MAG: 2-phosphoglycerate kinase [Actinobacteria bacterium]|nr:MAG: 2-phosphoglycerate kinase [Actinomycetota bacterium]